MATPEPTGYSELGGLRAWLAEVDRVLGIRTRIGLVLLALAVGLGAAALYLVLDTRDDAADANEVAALQKRVRALEGQRAGAGANLRTEVAAARTAADAARAQVAALQKRVGTLEEQVATLRAAEPAQAHGGATGAGTGAGGDAGTGAGGGQGSTRGGVSGDGRAGTPR